MKKGFILLFTLCSTLMAISQSLWPAVSSQTKPWTRWWWMGSAVNKQNISSSLIQYSQAGIGGVEVVPIYGAKGFENNFISYLSPQWMNMLDHTVQQSNKLNMGVYISVGTGWPIGGPNVSKQDAASKVIVQSYDLKANTGLMEKLVINDPKQVGYASLNTLMGFGENGFTIDLTGMVHKDGTLEYRSQTDLKLFAVFDAKTKQVVKRSAPGGEGFTIDHFSKFATTNYFKVFDTAFGNSSHGVKGFFNDSYEVYNADWTPHFFDEFKKRRGYDLRNYINVFFSDNKTDQIARLKSDYRETMSDLMFENFSQVFTNWTHKRKALSINQAHGSPGNLLDLYGAFDIPETETFGSSYFPIRGLRRDSGDIRNVDPDPVMLKFASSAAHTLGKNLTSSETFTWLTEHFKTAWSQCKPEVDQVFLSGVNHVFFHGTTFSPKDIKWPGWLFYASVNFVPTNSLWPHLKGLNDYITRCQSVLQTGESDNELAIYWPVYDIWHNANGMDMPLSVHSIDKWLHPTPFYQELQSLQKKGYSLDFISDRMISFTQIEQDKFKVGNKGGAYKMLIIPACEKMPLNTFKNILHLASEGATIILQQFPEDVPGFKNLEENRQTLKSIISNLNISDLKNGLQEAKVGKGRLILGDIKSSLSFLKIFPESLVNTGLQFIRRKANDATYYFVVNNTSNDIDEQIALNASGTTILWMNPLNGLVSKSILKNKTKGSETRIQLKSGESIIIKVSNNNEVASLHHFLSPASNHIDLSHNVWSIHFKDGGPIIPATKQFKGIKPWTDFTEDSATQSFSGTGVYSTSFVVKNKASEYLLKLDKIYESARVIINGKDAGIVWSLPFEILVGKYLKEGKNSIRIEVCNLMANRIRNMDKNGEVWRNYHEINFVNINYKNFDASSWKIQPSGLNGVIKLIPMKK